MASPPTTAAMARSGFTLASTFGSSAAAAGTARAKASSARITGVFCIFLIKVFKHYLNQERRRRFDVTVVCVFPAHRAYDVGTFVQVGQAGTGGSDLVKLQVMPRGNVEDPLPC